MRWKTTTDGDYTYPCRMFISYKNTIWCLQKIIDDTYIHILIRTAQKKKENYDRPQ